MEPLTKPQVRELHLGAVEASAAATAPRRALAVLVFACAFSWLLLTVELINDHFDRISRGRQILVYGERPFSDFRDPGYFLTLYTSAAAQAISGGSLLGEAVIDSAAIAFAVGITFLLGARAAESTGIGIVAAIFALIVAPRYYDYGKVLFYTAGLALAWRYADDRRMRTLLVGAMVTVAAGLFRYDNGVFLFGIFRAFPVGRLQNRAVHEPSGCAGSSRCSILRCSGTKRRTTFLKGTK